MDILKAKLNVQLDPKDYFYLALADDDTFTLTATDKSQWPIKFSNITRKQLYSLQAQIQNQLMRSDEERLVKNLEARHQKFTMDAEAAR